MLRAELIIDNKKSYRQIWSLVFLLTAFFVSSALLISKTFFNSNFLYYSVISETIIFNGVNIITDCCTKDFLFRLFFC